MNMGVAENNGTPKSSILIGFSIINHQFWDTTIFGNIHIEDCNKKPGFHLPIFDFQHLVAVSLREKVFFGGIWKRIFSVQGHHFPKSAIMVVVLSERAKVKVEHLEQLEERRNDPGKVDASCNLGLLFCCRNPR